LKFDSFNNGGQPLFFKNNFGGEENVALRQLNKEKEKLKGGKLNGKRV